ncbi:MAG: restriction endonuclease subunit S, partial [Mycoplasmoidaceae bacterium]
ILKNKNNFIYLSNGTTILHLSRKIFEEIIIYIPDINQQQKIIDIIEPFEIQKNNLNKKLEKIISILKKIYLYTSNSNYVDIAKFINLFTKKYSGQNRYIETSMISKCKINCFEEIKKLKSRANLTPRNNSIIISKLVGENKIYPIYDFELVEKYVFSTGFFNFSSNINWYIFGFLLNKSFEIQKSALATGTTMKGLNNNSIKKIKILDINKKYSKIDIDIILVIINKINKSIKIIEKIIENLIELYI